MDKQLFKIDLEDIRYFTYLVVSVFYLDTDKLDNVLLLGTKNIIKHIQN